MLTGMKYQRTQKSSKIFVDNGRELGKLPTIVQEDES